MPKCMFCNRSEPIEQLTPMYEKISLSGPDIIVIGVYQALKAARKVMNGIILALEGRVK